MAALFESLAVTGHRLTNGAANASGRCWVYKPGTTSPAVIYADQDETPLSNPVTLSAGGKATIYFAGQVDAFFENSLGQPIETIPLSERAERVEVKQAGFTGLLASGSQGNGGVTDLKTVLASIYASVGGLDGKYLEYTGATGRTLQSVIRGIQVSVKDYGAAGNGVADDTIPIQNAINEAGRLGGGVVYFDPGTYLISSALSVTVNGISLQGAGASISIIKLTNAVATAVSYNGVTGAFITRLGVSHTASSTGSGMQFNSCSDIAVERVSINAYRFGINLTGTTGFFSLTRSGITSVLANAADRGIRIACSGSRVSIVDNYVSVGIVTSPYAIELSSSTNLVTIAGNNLVSATSAVRFDVAFTGGLVWVTNNYTQPGISSGAAVLSSYFANGNDDGTGGLYSIALTSGGTATPDWLRGNARVRIEGTTTGVAYVVAAPTTLPTENGTQITIEFFNNAGGAVTGWTLNAVYHVAAAIPTANLAKTCVVFQWDATSSVLREVARGQTT